MHGGVSKLNDNISTVTMKSTFHTIESTLRTFANRLLIAPTFTLSPPDTEPLPDDFDIIHTKNDDDSLSPYRFYTDGSLINLGSTDLSMGIGWIQISDDDFIISQFSASINRTWPSSTKAETMSLLSILERLPCRAEVSFYLDSLATIQKFSNILSPTKYSNRHLKQPNPRLWLLINHLVSSKNLTVTLCKVKGHSGDVLNDRSDQLAKMGATSTNIFEPKFDNSPYLSFPLFYNSLPIDNNIRTFSKSLMDAKQFADFISLDRLTRYQQLSSLVDWPASWSFASFSLYASKQQTNFH